MDFSTVAFAEPSGPHVERGRLALASIGGVEIWRGFWMVPGRCGSPELQERMWPVYAAFAHPPYLPPGIVVSPLDRTCEIGIGSTMSHESRALYHRHIAADHELRHGRSNRAAYRYVGNGEQRFAALAEQIDNALQPPREATDLCRLMLQHGSDKSMGWHTYTPIYALLIASLPQAPRLVLEIGIGTNNEDVPSTMGANGVPGASLRGWRDFLPDAQVFGADVDTRILFEEERIRTFFVDQLDPATIERLWDELPKEPFDLIVDDGLHTLEAAEATLKNSLAHLHPDGRYVVEDVHLSGADAYLAAAARAGVDGVLIEIPHAVNASDNCLLIAAKPLPA